MNATTARIQPPSRASADESRSATGRTIRPPAPQLPTLGELLDEIGPLIRFVPVAGPSLVFIIVPWALLTLMLAGPLLLLVTFAAIALGAAVLVALAGAILATPYLLVTRLRGRRAAHAAPELLVDQLRTGQASHA